MAAELIDLRLKITAETLCVLAALARAKGDPTLKPQLAREALHAWAMEQIHAATLLDRCLRAKGLGGALGGATGASQVSSAQDLNWDEP